MSMWAEDDQPTTKLLKKGVTALSTAELVSIIIGSGTKDIDSLTISKMLLQQCENDINSLARMSAEELARHSGIGSKKATKIMAALELGRRRISEKPTVLFNGSRAVYDLLSPELNDMDYERFIVLALNRAHHLIKKIDISEGGISGTVADPKKIFKMALDCKASSIILCHNHPSGNVQPSENDIHLTRKLKEAGILLDLPVLDHLIIGNGTGVNSYFSFADEGMI